MLGGSVGFLSDLFRIFELTMVVVRGRKVMIYSLAVNHYWWWYPLFILLLSI